MYILEIIYCLEKMYVSQKFSVR